MTHTALQDLPSASPASSLASSSSSCSHQREVLKIPRVLPALSPASGPSHTRPLLWEGLRPPHALCSPRLGLSLADLEEPSLLLQSPVPPLSFRTLGYDREKQDRSESPLPRAFRSRPKSSQRPRIPGQRRNVTGLAWPGLWYAREEAQVQELSQSEPLSPTQREW